jgi:DNA-binding CsgD family transcriptional regulator
VCKAVEEFSEKIMILEKEESAKKMIARGKMSIEEIAEDLNLPIETVKRLAKV